MSANTYLTETERHILENATVGPKVHVHRNRRMRIGESRGR